jgi:hypothetical protein
MSAGAGRSIPRATSNSVLDVSHVLIRLASEFFKAFSFSCLYNVGRSPRDDLTVSVLLELPHLHDLQTDYFATSELAAEQPFGMHPRRRCRRVTLTAGHCASLYDVVRN